MVYHDPGDVIALLPSQLRSRRYQPGKRTILVSILLSFLLLMSQLLRALQLEHPPRVSNIYVLQVSEITLHNFSFGIELELLEIKKLMYLKCTFCF